MGTLWSELGPVAEAVADRPRVYADANVPSGVVASTVGPLQFFPALIPNRLWLLEPSARRISLLPQPLSRAEWATRNCGGTPVERDASTACGQTRLTKSLAVAGTSPLLTGAVAAGAP